MRLMNSPNDFTGPANIGNPGEYTILQLAEKIIEMTGASSKILFKPLPQDDPLQRKPDIELAKERLGWQPEVGLADGLRLTIDYFKDLICRKPETVHS